MTSVPDYVPSGTTPRSRWLQILLGPGFLRLALAFLVFVSHVSRFEVGRPAVMIFFMLSGYWVVRLYVGGNLTASRFELSRFLRVWPLFAFCALLVFAIGLALGLPQPGTLISTLPLLGLASRDGDLLGISWSLDIEMQFYLLLPVLVFAFRRGRLGLQPVELVCLLLLVFAFGAVLLSHGISSVAVYSPMFAAGAYVYLVRWSPSFRAAMLSLLLFVVCGLAMAIVPEFVQFLTKERSDWWRDIVHMFWCLTLLPFVAFNVHQRSDPLDRHMGNLSYPFYLVHTAMIAVGLHLFADSAMLAKAFGLVATAVLSLILYRVVDQPLEQLRKSVEHKRATDMRKDVAAGTPSRH